MKPLIAKNLINKKVKSRKSIYERNFENHISSEKNNPKCDLLKSQILTIDTTVSTISSTAHLSSSLNKNVFDHQVIDVQSFHLCVALSVSKISCLKFFHKTSKTHNQIIKS